MDLRLRRSAGRHYLYARVIDDRGATFDTKPLLLNVSRANRVGLQYVADAEAGGIVLQVGNERAERALANSSRYVESLAAGSPSIGNILIAY